MTTVTKTQQLLLKRPFRSAVNWLDNIMTPLDEPLLFLCWAVFVVWSAFICAV